MRKSLKTVLILIAAFFCASYVLAGSAKAAGKGPVVKKGDTVTLDYTLKVDGKVIDSTKGRGPFQFTAGENQVVPGFDKAVMGMRAGQTKNFTVSPKEGYGEHDPKKVSEVPRSQLPANVKPGMTVYQQDNYGRRPVKVVAFKGDVAVLDFNSPLAGKTLNFSIKILNVKKP